MMRYILIALVILAGLSSQAQAAEEPPAKKSAAPEYVRPTMENLSKLYWTLSLLDPENDVQIDNYLLINKCDVYRDYYHNEFEWKNIRQSARDLIGKEINTFPTHFAFIQPLKLGNYDLKTQSFELLDEYKIPLTTRFELYSDDINRVICEQQHAGRPVELEGYPRSLIVEFSRSFSLDKIKVRPEIAEIYIKDKMIPFNELKPELQTPEQLYSFRDAYIVMYIRMIAPKSMEYLDSNGRKTAQILGTLEEIEIYADPELTLPMYKEGFRN